ncbi:hypothetical protein AgCh_004657 [Apium graveolens]
MDGTIRIVLSAKDPLTHNNVLVKRGGNNFPCVIINEYLVLDGNYVMPLQIIEGMLVRAVVGAWVDMSIDAIVDSILEASIVGEVGLECGEDGLYGYENEEVSVEHEEQQEALEGIMHTVYKVDGDMVGSAVVKKPSGWCRGGGKNNINLDRGGTFGEMFEFKLKLFNMSARWESIDWIDGDFPAASEIVAAGLILVSSMKWGLLASSRLRMVFESIDMMKRRADRKEKKGGG